MIYFKGGIMVITTKENILQLLRNEGFEKQPPVPSVPVVTYKKDNMSVSFIHNRYHMNDEAFEFLKSKGIEYEEVEIREA